MKAGAIPSGHRGRFGWHNLRHSPATFFADSEVSQPVIQRALCHGTPATTAGYISPSQSIAAGAQGKYLEAIGLKPPEFRRWCAKFEGRLEALGWGVGRGFLEF